jgi:hypothetical protein
MNKSKLLYIKIAKSAIIFFSLLFIGDRIIGYELKKIYFNQKDGDYYQTTYAIKNVHEQLLIFGSSRALHHYVSPVFEKCTDKSTYNLGRDGKNIMYSEAILSEILSYHHPQEIILDVTPDEFSWKGGKDGQDEMVSTLLPYANNPSIYKTIEKHDKIDLMLSKVFWTYPYNSISAQIFGNYFGLFKTEKSINGYEPLTGNKINKIQNFNPEIVNGDIKSDSSLVNSFKNFIAVVRENKITCFVVVSPINQLSPNNCIPYLRKLTEEAGCQFYDCSNLKMFKKTLLYYDDVHLNNTGAVLFSNYLATQLKRGDTTATPQIKLVASSLVPFSL